MEGKKGFARITAFIDALRGGDLPDSRKRNINQTYDAIGAALNGHRSLEFVDDEWHTSFNLA